MPGATSGFGPQEHDIAAGRGRGIRGPDGRDRRVRPGDAHGPQHGVTEIRVAGQVRRRPRRIHAAEEYRSVDRDEVAILCGIDIRPTRHKAAIGRDRGLDEARSAGGGGAVRGDAGTDLAWKRTEERLSAVRVDTHARGHAAHAVVDEDIWSPVRVPADEVGGQAREGDETAIRRDGGKERVAVAL